MPGRRDTTHDRFPCVRRARARLTKGCSCPHTFAEQGGRCELDSLFPPTVTESRQATCTRGGRIRGRHSTCVPAATSTVLTLAAALRESLRAGDRTRLLNPVP